MTTYRHPTIRAAQRRAGCGWDDLTQGDCWSKRFRALLLVPRVGSDGDYTREDRGYFRQAADLCERIERDE